MKVCAISDQHGHLLNNIPECDLLLIAGDMCPVTNHDPYFQANWINTTFKEWLETLNVKHIVFTPGNHDFVFERAPSLIHFDELPTTYLQDAGCEIEGLKIWGSPWTPYFNNWAFNLDENDPNETRLTQVFSRIPNDTDILMTHGPPYEILDIVEKLGSKDIEHVGSYALRKVVMEVKPLVHHFGHIHNGGFRMINKGEQIICFMNTTIVNEAYDPVYDPTVFKIDMETKEVIVS